MTPSQDVERLLNEGLEVAREMLAAHGKFLPYGVVLTAGGEFETVMADDGRDEPDPQEIIDSLVEQFRGQAGYELILASGIFAGVSVTPPGQSDATDAVHVALEHRENRAVDVFLPYSRADDGVEFGKLFATKRAAVVFVG